MEFHKFLGNLKLLPADAIRFELQHQISSSPIFWSVRKGRCPKKYESHENQPDATRTVMNGVHLHTILYRRTKFKDI
ncbi:hypothetical protein SBA1_1110004 [Candidatus Sulfotelmatobacter kueseliae]|uniref:Uncharacterized protein n=1 Tax=Candidatus Sulfotelmatobacter kueseliae TaxID=2042962 RepID=A0A2U3JZY8_9BACT|nr:hypothetical protein SBA1_1110004 [Candidatus Sulfotelmatobacter kueseliae]